MSEMKVFTYVKLSLYAGNMILHAENPKNSTQKLFNLINKLSKVAEYKINIQKSVAFLYTYNEILEKEYKNTIPFWEKKRTYICDWVILL